MRSLSVLCVLGCRSNSDALRRRAAKTAEVFAARGAASVVACGGRAWDGVVEADELARLLVEGGVPAKAIVRERCSLDTRDNARFAAAMLGRRGVDAVTLITCTWHLPRATMLFRGAGFVVEGVGADPPPAGRRAVLARRLREGLATWSERARPMRLA